MNKTIRILLAGESTAGNLSPLIAVYNALKVKTTSLNDPVEFMLISTDSDFLKAFVKGTDIKYKILDEHKENQKTSFLTSLKGFSQVLGSIFGYMPDVIFLKGGYVSLPVAIVGKLFNIPIILHEANAVPNDRDKFIARFAKRIAVSFEKTLPIYDSKKVFFSGNPIDSSIAAADREESRRAFAINGDKPVLLILGGSEGIHEINSLVLEILPDLLEKYEIIHQCGLAEYEEIQSRVRKMNIPFLDNYHLFPFFRHNFPKAYAACDLVVSRAGANTVAEIMLVGKPSILIPFSEKGGDDQNQNAFFFAEAGAAVLLNEKNLKPHLFIETIDNIFKHKLKVMEMMRAARQLAHPEAADVVAEEIIRLSK